MRRQNLYDSTSVTYHALTFRKQGKSKESIELLRHESERLDDTNLYHHLADACLASGMMDEALNVYGNKLCQNQRMTRQYLVEYARILKATGNTRVLMEICEKVLSQKYFKNPTSDEDFYYDGFSNYLLGNHERARYDYERSSSIFEKYYNEL